MQIYLRLILNSIQKTYFQNSNNEPNISNNEEEKPMIFIGPDQNYIFIFYGDIIPDPDHGGRKLKFENPKFYFIKPKDEKGMQEFEKFVTDLKKFKRYRLGT